MVTFLPMLTEAGMPALREWLVWMVHLSPIEEKYPILTGFSSALIVTPYQIDAYLDTKTLPTSVAFGATHAS